MLAFTVGCSQHTQIRELPFSKTFLAAPIISALIAISLLSPVFLSISRHLSLSRLQTRILIGFGAAFAGVCCLHLAAMTVLKRTRAEIWVHRDADDQSYLQEPLDRRCFWVNRLSQWCQLQPKTTYRERQDLLIQDKTRLKIGGADSLLFRNKEDGRLSLFESPERNLYHILSDRENLGVDYIHLRRAFELNEASP